MTTKRYTVFLSKGYWGVFALVEAATLKGALVEAGIRVANNCDQVPRTGEYNTDIMEGWPADVSVSRRDNEEIPIKTIREATDAGQE